MFTPWRLPALAVPYRGQVISLVLEAQPQTVLDITINSNGIDRRMAWYQCYEINHNSPYAKIFTIILLSTILGKKRNTYISVHALLIVNEPIAIITKGHTKRLQIIQYFRGTATSMLTFPSWISELRFI